MAIGHRRGSEREAMRLSGLAFRGDRSATPSLRKVLAYIWLWRFRARSRRALSWLSDDQLRDIGVTKREALGESSKPFWRP